MVKLSIPRVAKCTFENCEELGLCQDGKCMHHTDVRKSHKLSEYSNPDNYNNPFGAELELYSTDNRLVRRTTYIAKSDCSLGYGGIEINHIDEDHRIGLSTAQIVQRLHEGGAKLHVDKRCGFHVHMSMPGANHMTAPHLRRFFNVVLPMQNEVFECFKTRRTRFCGKYNENQRHLGYISGRYYWVVPTWKQTFEMRIHPGTVCPNKIYAWLQVCRGLQNLWRDVMTGEDSELVKRAKDGHFIRLFKEGSIGRDYLQRCKDNAKMTRYGLPAKYEERACY